MKSVVLAILALGVCLLLSTHSTRGSEPPPYTKVDPEAMSHWRARKFGLFIHWGPNCQKGGEIGWSRQGPRRGRSKEGTGTIPMEIYDNLYKTFNPTLFDAQEWAQIAKDAGMKYMVFTSKHHDGFSMFDSAVTEYDIMSTPFQRDVVKELSEACKEKNLQFGVYYSPRDWYHADFATERHDAYLSFYMAQLKELVTNYKPLMVLWFDGLDSPRELWKDVPERSFELLRNAQPDIILNNRGGLPGDYDTPEQHIGGFNRTRPWETCMTIANQWSWKPNDQTKSIKQCIQTLLRVVGGDGNLLFNLGPRPDGTFEPEQVARLREMGQWLQQYGNTVYGTRGGPFKPGTWGASTCQDNKIFLFIMNWPGDMDFPLPVLPMEIEACRALTSGDVTMKETAEGVSLSMKPEDRDPVATVVELTVAGDAFQIDPVDIHLFGQPLAVRDATASNVFQNREEYCAKKAIDRQDSTRWATDSGTHEAWIELDLGKETTVGAAQVREAFAGRVQSFLWEVPDAEGWKTIHKGNALAEGDIIPLKPVTTRKIRFHITQATEGPTLWEIILYPPKEN